MFEMAHQMNSPIFSSTSLFGQIVHLEPWSFLRKLIFVVLFQVPGNPPISFVKGCYYFITPFGAISTENIFVVAINKLLFSKRTIKQEHWRITTAVVMHTVFLENEIKISNVRWEPKMSKCIWVEILLDSIFWL